MKAFLFFVFLSINLQAGNVNYSQRRFEMDRWGGAGKVWCDYLVLGDYTGCMAKIHRRHNTVRA